MKRKFLILICLILFFVSVSGVSAAEDVNQTINGDTNNVVSNVDTLSVSATEDVNQSIDDDTLSVSEDNNEISAKDDGTFTALQEKIDNARAGSTITLMNDYLRSSDKDPNRITIDKALTIDGNGYKIDADGYYNSQSRIFYITSSGVVLNDISFLNAYSTGHYSESGHYNGGAIYSEENLRINNCNFSNGIVNEAFGSAIYCEKNIELNNCIFTHNDGSAYSGYGQSSVIQCKKLVASNCKFIENHNHVYADDMELSNCLFENYGSTDYGAAYAYRGKIINSNFINIYWDAVSFSKGLDMKNSYFINCSRNAVYVGSDSKFDSCTFIGSNRESTGIKNVGRLNMTKCSVSNYDNGVTNDGYLWVYDSNFNSNNYALDNYGTLFEYNNIMGSNSFDIYNGHKVITDYNSKEATVYDGVTLTPVNAYVLNNSTIRADKGEEVQLTAYMTDDNSNKVTGGLLSFKLIPGNQEYNVTNWNNNLYEYALKLDGFSGTYKVYADYSRTGNLKVYYGILKVSGMDLDVPDVTKNYGGSERLVATLTENNKPIAGANINININGVDYPKTTDSNGQASMAINLPANTYIATVTYGDVSATAKVTVKQLTTKTALSSSNNSHNSVTLTATVSPSTATGNVVFNINGKDYPASKISDAKATYTLNDLAVGSYNAKATYKGDVNHKASTSDSVKFTVEDVKIDVSAPDLTKYYHGPERFVVTVKEDNKPVVGKAVTINLNGVPYTRTTDANGRCSMAINLNSGKYKITTEYDGIKVYSTVTIKDTVISKDFTKIFRNDTQYYATFVDSQGNVLKNTQVRLNINGVYYTRTTSDQGIAKMNINLNPGTYVLTAENPASGEQHTTVIKVLSSIVENQDLIKYYRNESKYTLRILDGNGKPVGAGVTVKLNINGVFYERKTNASGYMNMNINLNPGTYIVTAEYNGLMASNTVKVLPILSAKDVNMKYRDGTKFELKLLDGKGNPFAAQKITFNINGVFYERITDSNGIARLNLNLQAGQYIITSMYENGAALANKVTIIS